MTIIIFIIVLSVLVFVHEAGHFIMAKRAGMKVEEFGFGFPPRAWGYQPKNSETTYTINWIPFGGFVKILGEDGTSQDPRSFSAKKFLPKVSVIVAGVIMNVIMAVILLSIGNMIGSRVAIDEVGNPHATDIKMQITGVAKASPAEQAGLAVFDDIIGFASVESFQSFVAENKGKEIFIQLARGTIQVTPRLDPPAGEGALGISLAKTGFVRYAFGAAIVQGVKEAGSQLWAIIKGFAMLFKNLFTTGKAGAELTGPIGIAKITGQAAKLGFTYLIQFMAFLSLNLAVINIVPFPALDGGRLLFLIIEKIKGSPLPKRLEQGANTIGFILLIGLMIFITVKDVLHFW